VGAMFAYVTGAPTVLTRGYDLSPQQFGALIGLNGLAFMSASRLNMIALRTSAQRRVLARYVWMPVVFGAALFALTSLWALPLWMVVALQLSFFVTVGRVTPHVAALALAPHGAEAGQPLHSWARCNRHWQWLRGSPLRPSTTAWSARSP
jgi:DHA1 family bicyclomycin/chloramphenicol resistance-like MFS transporter